MLAVEIDERNKQLNIILCLRGIQVTNVYGKCNCLFGAVSLLINGTQEGQDALRQLVAEQVELHGDSPLGVLLKYLPAAV